MGVGTDKHLSLKPTGPVCRRGIEEDFRPAPAARGYHALVLQMQSYTCWSCKCSSQIQYSGFCHMGQKKCRLPKILGDTVLRS